MSYETRLLLWYGKLRGERHSYSSSAFLYYQEGETWKKELAANNRLVRASKAIPYDIYDTRRVNCGQMYESNLEASDYSIFCFDLTRTYNGRVSHRLPIFLRARKNAAYRTIRLKPTALPGMCTPSNTGIMVASARVDILTLDEVTGMGIHLRPPLYYDEQVAELLDIVVVSPEVSPPRQVQKVLTATGEKSVLMGSVPARRIILRKGQ